VKAIGRMAFIERQQAAGMEGDVGVGDTAIGGCRRRRIRQLAAEAAEQRAPASCSACHFGVLRFNLYIVKITLDNAILAVKQIFTV
jgi:hypothetical protein